MFYLAWLVAAAPPPAIYFLPVVRPVYPCAYEGNKALPPELQSMPSPLATNLVAARARLEAPMIVPGFVALATLLPQSEVTFAFPPATKPVPSPFAGALALHIARAGTYTIGLGNAAWIDVVIGLKTVASTGHAPGPPCSVARKIVTFALESGDYTLQLSNSADARVTVMVAARP